MQPRPDLTADVTVLQASRRYWWLIALCVTASVGLLVAGIVGLSAAGVVKGLHGEHATIEVRDPAAASSVSTGRSSDPQRYAANQLAVLTSRAVIDRALVLSKQAVTSDEVRRALSVSGAPDNDIVNISYKNESATVASSVVRSVVDAYREFVSGQQERDLDSAVAVLDSRIAAETARLAVIDGGGSSQDVTVLRQSITALDARRAELISERNGSYVTVLSLPDSKPAAGNSARSVSGLKLFSAVILGLILGCGLAYALARRRPRVAYAMQPSILLSAPMIAEFAKNATSEFPLRTHPNSPTSEVFRIAAAQLSLPNDEQLRRLHAVVGGRSGIDPTVVAANVALAMAQQGLRVALVDLGPHDHGVTSALEREAVANGLRVRRVESDELPLDTAAGNSLSDIQLSIVLAGGESEGRDLAHIDALFEWLCKSNDHVLVALPARGFGAVQLRIKRQVDDALVIVRHDGLLTDVDWIARQLALTSTPVVGYIYDRS